MMGKRTASQTGRLSRRKGKAFECWVARLFTKATGVKWETTRNSGRTDLRSDVYAPDLGEPFIVECKHRKEYELGQMMSNTKSLQDVVNKAEKENLPFIIIVKNQSGIWFTTGVGLKKIIGRLNNKYFYNSDKVWSELRGLKILRLDNYDFDFDSKVMCNYGKNKKTK